MREKDGDGKFGVAGRPNDLEPDVAPEGLRRLQGAGDEELYEATEDPAWSLKEPGSTGYEHSARK
jgi:hypothetical protein